MKHYRTAALLLSTLIPGTVLALVLYLHTDVFQVVHAALFAAVSVLLGDLL